MQRVHSVFNICKCSSKVRWLKPGTVQRTFSKDQTIQRDSVCFLQILKTFSSAVLIKTPPAEKCRESQRLTMDTCGDSKIIRLHWRLFFTTKEVVTFFLLKLSLLIHGDECDSITAGVMTEWGASLTTTCLQTVAQKESEDLDPDSDWIQVLNPSLLLLLFSRSLISILTFGHESKYVASSSLLRAKVYVVSKLHLQKCPSLLLQFNFNHTRQ